MTRPTRFNPILAGTLTSLLTFGSLSLNLHGIGHAAELDEGHLQSVTRPDTSIDWTRGIIVAKGSAVRVLPDAMISDARSTTRRAARTAAIRALLDGLDATCLDATTTVGAFLAAHQDARSKVEALANAATVVMEIERVDGSVETTVELELGELFGVFMQPATHATVYTQALHP